VLARATLPRARARPAGAVGRFRRSVLRRATPRRARDADADADAACVTQCVLPRRASPPDRSSCAGVVAGQPLTDDGPMLIAGEPAALVIAVDLNVAAAAAAAAVAAAAAATAAADASSAPVLLPRPAAW